MKNLKDLIGNRTRGLQAVTQPTLLPRSCCLVHGACYYLQLYMTLEMSYVFTKINFVYGPTAYAGFTFLLSLVVCLEYFILISKWAMQSIELSAPHEL